MLKFLPNKNSELQEYIPFSNVDFIVSDIDGTLITGETEVVRQIKTDIRYLQKQKIYLTVATGRTYGGALGLLRDLGIRTGMPVALYNGGVVIGFGTENILYVNYIGIEIVTEILKKIPLKRVNAYLYTFGKVDYIFQREKTEPFFECVYGIGPGGRERDTNGTRIIWTERANIPDSYIVSLLVETKNMTSDEEQQIMTYLQNNHHIACNDSGNGFIEIKASGQSKGIIFEILKAERRYNIKKILAIGDNENDIELFQHADIGVAVGNTPASVMGEADYVCEHDSANGFLDMLNVIRNARRYSTDRGKG